MRAIILAAALLPLAGGCAELATGLANYADQLDAEQGNYYPDQHHSDPIDEDCPGVWEYGRVNNQTYQRIRNTGSRTTEFTLSWNTGLEMQVTLDPGETSDIYYQSPSILPGDIHYEC